MNRGPRDQINPNADGVKQRRRGEMIESRERVRESGGESGSRRLQNMRIGAACCSKQRARE